MTLTDALLLCAATNLLQAVLWVVFVAPNLRPLREIRRENEILEALKDD